MTLYGARMERGRRRRFRRRLAGFATVLLLGLSLGTIYATGFATTGGETGTTGNASPINDAPGDKLDTSGLNGLITNPTPDLTWNWSGRNGSVNSAVMYEANLTGEPGGNNYFVGVYLTNSPVGFSDLQLQVRIAAEGGDNACTISDLTDTATSNYRVFVMDTNDAQVTFSGMGGATTGLPGSERYCIGVVDYTGAGKDPAGTFIRRISSSTDFPPGIYPTFVAALNRMP